MVEGIRIPIEFPRFVNVTVAIVKALMQYIEYPEGQVLMKKESLLLKRRVKMTVAPAYIRLTGLF